MPDRPLVIAHVLNGLMFGGNENLCLQLIKHSPPGFQHVLFNLNPPRTEMKELFMSCPGLTLVDRAYARNARMRFLAGMTLDLKRVGADAVLVYTFGVHVFVSLSARAAGIRRVLARAGNPPPSDAGRRRVWRRIVIASRVLKVPILSCSAMVDRELRALAGTLPEGSKPFLNGVDVAKIERLAASERAKKEPGSPKIVGMVARFDSIKDHDTLLEAFARIRAQLGDTELWLIGDGARRSTIAAQAAALGITSSVRFLGERPDVAALLGAMDVFAFSTTEDEGFGIALAEAMAARTPIVASDVGACREVLGGAEAGRLVPPRSAHDLATAIVEILDDPESARGLTERAYLRVKQHLDITACAQRYYAALAPARSDPHRA